MSQRLFLVGDYYVSVPTKCAIVFSGHLANAATELMKLDHEEPQLTEPYLSKQKKLMVSLCVLLDWEKPLCFTFFKQDRYEPFLYEMQTHSSCY